MNKSNKPDYATLRQKAEVMLKSRKDFAGIVSTDPDTLKLIHELDVYQVELELQNEELLLGKHQAELAVEKYSSLYDFAPTGYFTLSVKGIILELNLAGARMLGRERSRLKNSSFGLFVSGESKPAFNRFLAEAFTNNASAAGEVSLEANDGIPMVVILTGTGDESGKRCLVTAVDITGRKQAEENLFRLAQRSRAWLENSPVCTKIVDLDFNLQYMSEAGIKGLQIDDITPCYGKPYPFHFYSESFKTGMTGNMIRAKETGKVITQEAPVADINGHEVWYHSTIVPVKDLNDRVEYLLIVSLDTTKQRQAEIELSLSEEKYRHLYDCNQMPIAIFDIDTLNFLSVNSAWVDKYGYTKEEFLSMTILEIRPESEIERVKQSVKINGNGLENVGEYLHKKKNGEIIHVEIIRHDLIFEGKNAKLVFANDISQRKQADEALQQSEELFKAIFENSLNPIMIADDAGNYLKVNQAAAKMFHYSVEKLLQMNVSDLQTTSSPDAASRYQEYLAKGFEIGEFDFVRPDKSEAVAQYHAVRVRENFNLSILSDITGRKLAEQRLKRIEWLLTSKPKVSETMEQAYKPPYDDLVALSTSRLILDSVGEQTLTDIVGDYLNLLDTSSAVYEKNGDYALGIFSSGWCRFMDAASRKVCGTHDNRTALDCGQWHCHESCWSRASKTAIETGQPADIECDGGIRLYAVPIRMGNEIIGAINIGYGDPPRDEEKLRELASRYQVGYEELHALAEDYESRPAFIIDLAKNRLHASARLIGVITERKLAEEKIRKNMDEMHRFHRLTVGRELKMIELKKEVNELCRQLGWDERHPIAG